MVRGQLPLPFTVHLAPASLPFTPYRSMYTLAKDIPCHKDSVVCLEFSPDGSCLASGDDGGLLVVSTIPDGEECARFHFEDSVSALTWARDDRSLFVGLANCRLHFLFLDDEKTYSVDFSPEGYEDLPRRWKDRFQINCLTYYAASNLLAIGVGVEVRIISSPTPTTYTDKCTIAPFDTAVPSLQAALSSIPPTGLAAEVRSIHFIDDGKAVVVSFLEEGIRCYDIDTQTQRWLLRPKRLRIGKSAVNRQGKLLVCSNLYDGFDIYDISSRKALRWLRSFHREVVNENVILPVAFVHEDSLVLLGSACGNVILSSTTVPPRVAKLDHDADIITALAASMLPGKQPYIATGCAEKGRSTYVRLWKNVPTRSGSTPPNRILVSKSVSTDMSESPPQQFHADGRRRNTKTKRPGRPRSSSDAVAAGQGQLKSYVIGMCLGAFMVLLSTLPLFDQYKARWHQLAHTVSQYHGHQSRETSLKTRLETLRKSLHADRGGADEGGHLLENDGEKLQGEVFTQFSDGGAHLYDGLSDHGSVVSIADED